MKERDAATLTWGVIVLAAWLAVAVARIGREPERVRLRLRLAPVVVTRP
jgi:hypothetical protein